MSWLGAHLPADLVPLADLVHAIREGAEGGEEDGGGAGPRGGDPARVAHGRETARRRPVLHHRHLLDAGHPRLVPHQGLRHLRSPIRTPDRRPLADLRAPRGDQTSAAVARVSGGWETTIALWITELGSPAGGITNPLPRWESDSSI